MPAWPDPRTVATLAALQAVIETEVPAAQALRRELHRHPDLSGAERHTAERLRHALPTLHPVRVAETGFLVRVGPPGPAVVVRSELDALPIFNYVVINKRCCLAETADKIIGIIDSEHMRNPHRKVIV